MAIAVLILAITACGLVVATSHHIVLATLVVIVPTLIFVVAGRLIIYSLRRKVS